MILLYAVSRRDSNPLPLLRRKQSIWYLALHLVKDSGTFTYSHHLVILSTKRLCETIPLVSMLLRTQSTPVELSAATLATTSQEYTSYTTAFPFSISYTTITLPTRWPKDWILLPIIHILNVSRHQNEGDYFCIHSMPFIELILCFAYCWSHFYFNILWYYFLFHVVILL